MATAIREFDLASPVGGLEGLDQYTRAMIVLRWRGRIVGRVFTDVAGGRVSGPVLQAAIDGAVERHAWQAWIDDYVGYDERRSIDASRPTATVAICTRERPDDLRRALAAVMQLHGEGHDALVIDNAPASDATRRVVQQFPRVRYVCEPTRGLNAARNRAMREARGDVVAFTDDDAVPEPAWLESLLTNFFDPRVLCVTGLTLPLELETEAQELFERHCPFERGFRRRVFDGQRDNPLHVGPVGAGANMALRKSVLARVGMFDERLDGGMPTRSGGDHDMFARILSSGYRIVYDPAAVSWHRHRRTKDELIDTVYGYGVGVYAMWTGMLIERRELGALKLAWAWLRHGQLPTLIKAWRRRIPEAQAELVRAELRGCLHGPSAWFEARRLRRAGA